MSHQDDPDSVAADRQIIEIWIRDHPSADARLTRSDDSAVSGGAVLIVNVPDREEMMCARMDLSCMVTIPERLRVRRWKPSQAEIDRVQDWIWAQNRQRDGRDASVAATWPDPESGLLSITLNRIDPKYARELEDATDGLAFVRPEPDEGVSLG